MLFVMSLCDLRGIDAQRSSFDGIYGGSGNAYQYFCGIAYNSKSRTSMPWACPIRTFGGSDAMQAVVSSLP